MCWSGEASAILATFGFATTAYAAYKGEPKPLWMALGYFSLMEALQAFTYSVIDQCGVPSNQIATMFGYLHIAFQPFFINAFSMHFIPEKIQRKIAPAVYGLCFVSAIFMILQMYPFDWAGHCWDIIGRIMCGENLCSVHGSWHIAWELPLNGIGNSLPEPLLRMTGGHWTYVIVAFALPILYGSWRMTTYHYLVGPLLAHATTSNMNEWPAVWCLLSIGLLAVVVKTPFRQYLYVKNWILWPKNWLA